MWIRLAVNGDLVSIRGRLVIASCRGTRSLMTYTRANRKPPHASLMRSSPRLGDVRFHIGVRLMQPLEPCETATPGKPGHSLLPTTRSHRAIGERPRTSNVIARPGVQVHAGPMQLAVGSIINRPINWHPSELSRDDCSLRSTEKRSGRHGRESARERSTRADREMLIAVQSVLFRSHRATSAVAFGLRPARVSDAVTFIDVNR